MAYLFKMAAKQHSLSQSGRGISDQRAILSEFAHNKALKNCTERKKWSRNDSRVEPFSCPQDGPHVGKNGSTLQSGAVLAPLFFQCDHLLCDLKTGCQYAS